MCNMLCHNLWTTSWYIERLIEVRIPQRAHRPFRRNILSNSIDNIKYNKALHFYGVIGSVHFKACRTLYNTHMDSAKAFIIVQPFFSTSVQRCTLGTALAGHLWAGASNYNHLPDPWKDRSCSQQLQSRKAKRCVVRIGVMALTRVRFCAVLISNDKSAPLCGYVLIVLFSSQFSRASRLMTVEYPSAADDINCYWRLAVSKW